MMKAAVLKKMGTTPIYDDFLEPKINSENQILMQVKAVAIKNLDKLIASGKHYSGYKNLPAVVGMDGVGELEDGRLVYTQSGSILAEKVLIDKDNFVELPKEIDLSLAAALPNAALGSYLPLMVKGKFEEGKVVLINGGTGITGKFAIQLAKYFEAGKIIVTGRIEGKEKELYDLGADLLISTEQNDDDFQEAIQNLLKENGIDIILDYLWGRSAEIIMNSISGDGNNYPEKAVKLINLGNMAGNEIKVNCNILRSSKLEVMGSGLGSYAQQEFSDFYQNILPKLFKLAAEGKLNIAVEEEDLANIENAWHKSTPGKRLVIKI